jgi:hypothetical protein
MDGIRFQASGRPPVDPSAKGSIEGLVPMRGRGRHGPPPARRWSHPALRGGLSHPLERASPPFGEGLPAKGSSTFGLYGFRFVAHRG